MSDDIAESLDAGDVCSAAVRADELLAETLRSINEGQVPAQLQEPLTARANELVNEVNCPPPVQTETETTETETQADEDQGEGRGKKKGKKDKDGDG
jgi:predicted secreted protein